MAIEKDKWAHATLTLRNFWRQFPRGSAPDEYYDYIRGQLDGPGELASAFAAQWTKARQIAWQAELGRTPFSEVRKRVSASIGDSKYWALLGGPPCQAYSVMGRARMGGQEHFSSDHRHTLYREYLKVVATFAPTVFVMENVKGILSSKFQEKLIFPQVLRDMRRPWETLDDHSRAEIREPPNPPEYRVYSFAVQAAHEEELTPRDFILESEHFGIPQRRHRVILLGVRADYDARPEVLYPAGKSKITLREVIGNMPVIRSRISAKDSLDEWRRVAGAMLRSGYLSDIKDKELKSIIRRNVGRVGDISEYGGAFVSGDSSSGELTRWLLDPRLGGVVQHESRSHMESDIHRYIFASSYATRFGKSPKLEDFPPRLWPDHANAVSDESGRVANFRDRFRVQVWDEPATTVTSHIAKDGHYFIHPDPRQCRSLTVREAARLQTFPDNYFFEGGRTQQFQQIGNAVPPFLAYQCAHIVADVIQQCMDKDVSRDRLKYG